MEKYLIKYLFIAILACSSLIGIEIDATHTQGNGVGYKRQYSKIGIYHAFENYRFQPFIDLRYLVLNKGKQGANLGAGIGYQFAQESRLSAYAFFDLTESSTNHIFNQMMGGLSYSHPLIFSGKDWGEIASNFNGYFPLKSHEKRIKNPSFGGFKGNNLLICQTDRYALTGSNLEIGYLSSSWNNWNLYAAGSAYYFKRSDLHAFGGYGKLRLTYNNLISIEGQVSGDRLFGTNINGTIGIRIPLGKREMKAVKNRQYSTHKSRPVERFEPIVSDKNKRKIVAKDRSGAPLNFIFVNNLNGSDGTFEDPFATLADAQSAANPGDIIYVFPGDGTTKGMDQGFVMQERQTLAGSGVALDVSTNKGSIIIPALTLNGPQMTFSSGNGVEINRDCTVSGITVSLPYGGGGIESPFNFDFSDGTASVRILNCVALGNGFPKDLIAIEARGTSVITATVVNCLVRDTTRDGFEVRSQDTATLNAKYINCSAVNCGEGWEADLMGSSNTNLAFINCSAVSGSDEGYSIDPGDSVNLVVNFSQCKANNNDDEGFRILTAPLANVQASFINCSANSNGTEGFRMDTGGTTQGFASFTNCTSSNNSKGFLLQTTGTSSINTQLENCNSTNNTAGGFEIKNSGTSITGSLDNCSAVGNGSFSFDIDTPGAGTFTITGDGTIDLQL
ncbi:MAG: hypothetical protein KFB95_01830 [Simkaniaceae bacterium]|nr:MAG: hypothetical protein KFB95_01830 [Simkaniaceae bacterium]